eukprot:s1727_g16.t1
MQIMLTQLRLTNVANFCYCNSTMFSLWWALLSRHDYAYGDWGESQSLMQKLFSRLDDSPVNVPDHFAALFTLWDNGNRPADAAEFAFWVLTWMKSPSFSHRWERSYTIENLRRKHDAGDQFAPLFLQVPHIGITTIALSDLLQRWTQEYGMQTALLEAPAILCCHVDRTARCQDGTLDKLQFWLHADNVCTIPVWTPDDRQVMHEYVPISMLAHLGDVMGGHYRAALRLTVAEGTEALRTQHTLWALTDDNEIPQIHNLPGLPEWFCRCITLVFLVRSDLVDIYRPLRVPCDGWMRLRTLRQQVARNLQADAQALAALTQPAENAAPPTAIGPPPLSTHQAHYVPHPLQAKKPPADQDGPKESVPFDGKSSYTVDYIPHPLEARDSAKPPKNVWEPGRTGVKTGKSTYACEYPWHNVKPPDKTSKQAPPGKAVPFEGLSSYQQDYVKHPARPRSATGRPKPQLPASGPFEGCTTYTTDYKRFQVPQTRPIRMDGSNLQSEPKPFEGSSEYRREYLKHPLNGPEILHLEPELGNPHVRRANWNVI